MFSPGCRPLDESITKEMFKAADTDGDGEISLDELQILSCVLGARIALVLCLTGGALQGQWRTTKLGTL